MKQGRNNNSSTLQNGKNDPVGLVFPCVLDIKVFLKLKENNVELVRDVLLKTILQEDLQEISSKESKNSKYQSFSCRVNAQSKTQMDELFLKLSSHPEVLMVI